MNAMVEKAAGQVSVLLTDASFDPALVDANALDHLRWQHEARSSAFTVLPWTTHRSVLTLVAATPEDLVHAGTIATDLCRAHRASGVWVEHQERTWTATEFAEIGASAAYFTIDQVPSADGRAVLRTRGLRILGFGEMTSAPTRDTLSFVPRWREYVADLVGLAPATVLRTATA